MFIPSQKYQLRFRPSMSPFRVAQLTSNVVPTLNYMLLLRPQRQKGRNLSILPIRSCSQGEANCRAGFCFTARRVLVVRVAAPCTLRLGQVPVIVFLFTSKPRFHQAKCHVSFTIKLPPGSLRLPVLPFPMVLVVGQNVSCTSIPSRPSFQRDSHRANICGALARWMVTSK